MLEEITCDAGRKEERERTVRPVKTSRRASKAASMSKEDIPKKQRRRQKKRQEDVLLEKKSRNQNGKHASKRRRKAKRSDRNILYGPAFLIERLLPSAWVHLLEYRFTRFLKQRYSESDASIQEKARLFLLKEIALFFWGVLLIIATAAGIAIYHHLNPEKMVLERNTFGNGEHSISVSLKKGEEQQDYSYAIQEQELSEKKIKQLFADCFLEVEENMLGENTSIDAVNHPLVFDSSMAGYPFQIDYRSENPDYIRPDGSMGKEADVLQEQEHGESIIHVMLHYEDYYEEKEYKVTVIPKTLDEKEQLFAPVIEMLKKLESETRMDSQIEVPETYDGVTIVSPKRAGQTNGILIFLAGIIIFLLVHNYHDLKEQALLCRKSTVRDFPDIVHYLTLYMGAGLSFASAVSRISEDYQRGAYGFTDRYAYDQIVRMDQQIQMGASQKEACLKWGNQFEEVMYQKLSMMLVQSFSKGAKEASVMLEQVRRDAFRQYIDQSKRLGEEASTKLLFPMIILMGLVMFIVMVPAIVQFQFV